MKPQCRPDEVPPTTTRDHCRPRTHEDDVARNGRVERQEAKYDEDDDLEVEGWHDNAIKSLEEHPDGP